MVLVIVDLETLSYTTQEVHNTREAIEVSQLLEKEAPRVVYVEDTHPNRDFLFIALCWIAQEDTEVISTSGQRAGGTGYCFWKPGTGWLPFYSFGSRLYDIETILAQHDPDGERYKLVAKAAA